MIRARREHRGGRRGFTLVEAIFSTALLGVLAASVVTAVSSMMRTKGVTDTSTLLQMQGSEALTAILDDLRVSGFSVVGATEYPVLFENGDAPTGFDDHDHRPAEKAAATTHRDYGPNREIIFVQPRDADEDGRPDIGVNGAVVWSNQELSYVVMTAADGVNYLERRVGGAEPRRIASHIERITFDDINSSGFEVPLGAIRVRISFRMPDGDGLVHKYVVQATTRLRNSDDL